MTVHIAFYSFKGGVGRSMALANVGWALAAMGKRVLLVDMDLEAPGLHGCAELAAPEGEATPGVVELAATYAETGTVPPIDGHFHAVTLGTGRGRLWVMPAGRMDASYQRVLPGIDWRRLHPVLGSDPFVSGLRARIAERLQPHYVLIDARTGFSDVGGLSTHRLADQVVLVFNLTRPCILGTAQAYESMVARDAPPHVVLVASPVPPIALEEGGVVQRRIKGALELMPRGAFYGQEVLRVDYDPALALAETLAVRRPDDFRAAAKYEQLAKTLMRANLDEVLTVVDRATELQREGRARDAIAELRAFVDPRPGDLEAQLAFGRFLLGSGGAIEARTPLKRATQLGPDDADAWEALGLALAALPADAETAIDALERAEALGCKTPALYAALQGAHIARGAADSATDAGRRAVLASLEETGTPPPDDDEPFDERRLRFLEAVAARPPHVGFDAARFWRQVQGSLSLTREQKRDLIRRTEAGQLREAEARRLARAFEEESDQWLAYFGPVASELEARVGDNGIGNTREEILSLIDGGELDAVILTHAAHSPPGPVDLDLLRRAVSLNAPFAGVYRALADQLRIIDGETPSQFLREAFEHYARAVSIDPNDYDALNNWGNALDKLARRTEGDDRCHLFREGCKKYAQAVGIRPDRHEAWFNWGFTLMGLAKVTPEPDRQRLFRDACEKYALSLAAKADSHHALNNWGNSLAELARLARGAEQYGLFVDACDKYAQAVAIKPDKHEALFNWGIGLAELARLAEGDERRALSRDACEKYAQAVAVKPDMYESLFNWGNTLAALGHRTQGDEQSELFRDACAKYAGAIAVKPDMQEALGNWGIALAGLAHTASGDERRQLNDEACEKYGQAIDLREDDFLALRNWGNALEDLARLAEGQERRTKLSEACDKYARSVAIKADEYDTLNNWGVALAALARATGGDDQATLFREACGKYAQALSVKPDKHEALNNWAGSVLHLAALATDPDETWRLATEAAEHARAASALSPRFGDYNLACALSRLGQFEDSAAALASAFDFKPELRTHALTDPDLAPLFAARPDLRPKPTS